MGHAEQREVGNIYGTIQLKPVGFVRNQSREPNWGPSLSSLDWKTRAIKMKGYNQATSEIEIDPALDGILDGIEAYSHLTIIFWAHLVPDERRSHFRGHPMGNKDFPMVGIFATRSPIRPNGILTTVVRLMGRQGNTLQVTGLDALDGSPVLDIKPYYPEVKPENMKLPDWMKQINREFNSGECIKTG
jgi:tRNA (adenine37-N6)-methyltransferase